MTAQAEAVADRLPAAVRRHLGQPGDIRDLKRLTAGATKATWSFVARVGDRDMDLVMQQSVPQVRVPGGAPTFPRLSGDEDARLMIAADAAGVPVPPVRFILDEADGLDTGWVMDFVAGETLGRRINTADAYADARRNLAAECGAALARIHAIDPAPFDFLVDHTPAVCLAVYRAVVDRSGLVTPALELGLKWAEAHLPRDARTTLCHGDFRNGNLIVDQGGLAAILDWEIAHLGDPMSDLGWICVNTWRFGGAEPVGGFGAREDMFRAYEAAGGGAVDPDHVLFWEIFGSVKWAIMCLKRIRASLDAGERHIEAAAIGRRIEEPLYDFVRLIA